NLILSPCPSANSSGCLSSRPPCSLDLNTAIGGWLEFCAERFIKASSAGKNGSVTRSRLMPSRISSSAAGSSSSSSGSSGDPIVLVLVLRPRARLSAGGRKYDDVTQVSKPAVSPTSQPADRSLSGRLRIWKSARQQVWKPALQNTSP